MKKYIFNDIFGVFFAFLFMASASLSGATFTVTNTNATGAGSLHQAILDANSNAGMDNIDFNIPGTGPHVITPDDPLSTNPLTYKVTEAVVIDGYTQPGATPSSSRDYILFRQSRHLQNPTIDPFYPFSCSLRVSFGRK